MTVLPFQSQADVTHVLPKVAAHLAEGGILGYPTETVYGLGSRLHNRDLATLAKMTRRPTDKPFLVLVAGKTMVGDCQLEFNKAATRLAGCFWPGPLTLVLPGGRSAFPDTLRGPERGIAVRWSSHANTSRLIEALGFPISSTSANISGRETLTDAAGILAEFSGPANSGELLVLDGGTLGNVPSSTLVDCTSDEPRMLREGALSTVQIQKCLEEVNI